MPLFPKPAQKHSVAIAMTGVALGDRLLQVGCTDSSLLEAIGAKVGLSGRVCALVATDAEGSRAQRAAQKAGFLLDLDIGPLDEFPYDAAAFNLIVVDDQEGLLAGMTPESRVAFFREAHRTLQARGRIVIIERAARGGLGALFKTSTPVPVDQRYQSSGGATAALEAEGFRAVRLLAERDGLSFFEGVR